MKRVESNPILSEPQLIPQRLSPLMEEMERRISKPAPPGFPPLHTFSVLYLTSPEIPSHTNIYIQRPILVCIFPQSPFTNTSTPDVYSLEQISRFGSTLFSYRYFFIHISSTGSSMVWIGLPNEYELQTRSLFSHLLSSYFFLTKTFLSSSTISQSSLSPLSSFSSSSSALLSSSPYPIQQAPKTVKIMCNWMSSADLGACWDKMSQGQLTWNSLTFITQDDARADYYVIINRPPYPHIYYAPQKTIVFRMEPDTGTNPYWNNWFLSASDFMWFMDLDRFRNNSEWHLSLSHSDLTHQYIPKTHNRLSSVVSSLYVMEGHRLRLDFLKYLEEKHDPDIQLDIYGKTNSFQFHHYRGELPYHQKDNGILPYKYTFIAENCSRPNYLTEKILDAILGETLCFYWGCSNIESFLHPLSYVKLDLHDKEQSFQTVKLCISMHEWECRLPFIRQEKAKILAHYSLFPRVESLIYTSEVGVMALPEFIPECIQAGFKHVQAWNPSIRSFPTDQDTLLVTDHLYPNFVDTFSFVLRLVYTCHLSFSVLFLPRMDRVMRSSFPFPEDYFCKVADDYSLSSSFLLCRGDHTKPNLDNWCLRVPDL